MRTSKKELVRDNLKPFVGKLIKDHRLKYNYSLEDLAKAINYQKNRQTLHKYETGLLNIPYDLFFQICRIFNIDTSVLSNIDISEEEKNKLLVADKKRTSDNTSYIVFANDVYELNDEQKAKIDSIVAKYKNTPQNKIAIYSYNFDNGVDSFKKKRTSLNRAVEIRSYLLKKGYKNFSIKVININNESDKSNMVKLQEI